MGSESNVSASGAVNQTAIGFQTTGQADNSVTLGNADVEAIYMAQDKGAIVYANYFQSTTNNSSGYSSVFIHDGNNADRFGIVSRAGVDSPSSAGDCIYMKFQDGDGGDGGAIRCSSSVGTPEFVAGSDKRIKKDIKDTSIKGIETINAIPLKEFNWKSVKERPKTPIGIIADDLEKVLPNLVAPLGDETGWEHCREDGDAPLKAIPAESQITLILMKAVQELTAKVEALEKK
jgi:hypothetical protein